MKSILPINIKHTVLRLLSLCMLCVSLAACQDELLRPDYYGEGEGAIRATVEFYELDRQLATRANEPTGGTAGNAIEDVNSLCVVLFDSKGNFIRKFYGDDLEGYSYKQNSNTSSPSDAIGSGEHQAQRSTGQATFNIGVKNTDNRLPYAKYHMYAVANMGDLSAYTFENESDLQKIILEWKQDIASNNQMFGYFTLADKQKSEGFTGEIVVNKPQVSVHSWIKRAVSKVTVAFDGRNIKENVWIFIKSVEIKDIPKQCYLGATNPAEPDKEIEFADSQDQTMIYGTGTDYSSETWPAFISSGHPIYGMDPDAANNTALTYEEQIEAQHTETTNALYFFENMQGKGVAGTVSDKHQQVNKQDSLDKVVSYPDGYKPDNEAWKDAKKYGTYIEVKAYYYSINQGDPGQGEIIYRFMLGKDTHLDYNAQRNYHYKLTLCFNGYANDVDWHIEYDKEEKEIENPNPYYISYLYNHSMMLPLEFDAGDSEVESITAKITSNGWAPIGADGEGATSSPLNNQYKLYWEPSDKPTDYAFNGFLSLRKTTATNITIDDSWQKTRLTMFSNNRYYSDSKRGEIEYTNITASNYTLSQALDEGKIHVTIDNSEVGHNKYNVHLPIWTRAKQLIKQSAYTGNNPFVAYQREAKVKVSVKLKNGKVLNTGLSVNGSNVSGEEIPIRQVRRVVNPKGIWRDNNNRQDFRVTLNILPGEESTSFTPLNSIGPWRAYVFRDTKRGTGNNYNWNDKNGTISLDGAVGTTTGSVEIEDKNDIKRTYQTVEGKTGSLIDFTVKFNGTATDNTPNHAIIRIEYHNYTCVHLIFVRQGYGADDLSINSTKWLTRNNIAKDKIADSPLDEGSMFKLGNWDYPIKAENNVNKKNGNAEDYWIGITPDDFKHNAAGDTPLKIEGQNDTKFSDITHSGSFDAQTKMRNAELNDYLALYNSDDIEMGYGVLYGPDSEATLTDIKDVYGYMSSNTNKDRGMRGCFVYNYKTGKNLFFPIGASGYGHRKSSLVDGDKNKYSGVLRYSCNDRWGYFPVSGFDYGSMYGGYPEGDPNTGVNLAPLFFDIFRRPGAIYWFGQTTTNPIEGGTLCGWDINYFSFDFFPISLGNLGNGDDAAFIRSVQK